MRYCGQVIDDRLKKWFGIFGKFVGNNPGYFVIIPPLVCCIFLPALRDLKEETDIELLFSPIGGRGQTERRLIQERFILENPMFFFDPSRRTWGTRVGTIIVTPKPGVDTLLTKKTWEELRQADAYIRENVTITHDGAELKYQQLCARFFLVCLENAILDLADDVETNDLTFPAYIQPGTNKTIFLLGSFGSAKLDENGFVKDVPAIKLAYFLSIITPEDEMKAKMWEQEFMRKMATLRLETMDVTYFAYQTMVDEMQKNTNSVVPFMGVAAIIILGFCAGTSMMGDCVRSKPFLALQGVLSAMMATGAAFGLCSYAGVLFAGMNMAAPFLMLGIGMDDTFVVLSAWRRTSIKDSVPERLSQAYADAAVSITITSLTDMLSYFIGAVSPFRAVQAFCIYSGASVALTYIFHITFFGGCLAFAGRLEAANKHAITYRKVLPVSESGNKSRMYQIFCSGGISEKNPDDPVDNKDHVVMTWFRDSFAPLLTKTAVKIAVVLVFIGYIGVGIYGITQIDEGLQRKHMVQETSYAYEFYETEDKYFRDYPYQVQMVITEPLDYSDPLVQKEVLSWIENAQKTQFISEDLSIFWLRDFLRYNATGAVLTDISDPTNFITELRSFLYKLENLPMKYFLDVVFGQGNDSNIIVASRALVQAADLNNYNDDAVLMTDLRKVCDAVPFDSVPFMEYFVFFDQFLLIRPVTIQNVGIAAAVMLVISLLLIPNPVCAIWVGFSIVSIEVGVVGYMSLWGVDLDAISMITVIMCIGFSVDFSAHVSYAFVSSEGLTAKEKIKDALHHMGLPIIQGCLSTVLGLIPIIFVPSYIFFTFFKVTTLVMLFGTLHGLILLPVLFSLFTCNTHQKRSNKNNTQQPNGLENHGFEAKP